MRAVVLLSGGLDSATALALATRQEEEVRAIAFDYGQRHTLELEKSKSLADHFGVKWWKVPVPIAAGTSVLMTDAAMPHLTYEELAESEGPSPTYVPYRNGTFLSIAASHALDWNFDTIYAGMHAEDAHNWAYPDCTPEFIGAMQNAIYIGTYHKVRLVCPFTYKSKAEVVALGAELGVPFRMTWSCYEGEEPACGQCPTCVGRLEAFRANGFNDPLEYKFDQYRGKGDRLGVIQTSAKLRDMLEERSKDA